MLKTVEWLKSRKFSVHTKWFSRHFDFAAATSIWLSNKSVSTSALIVNYPCISGRIAHHRRLPRPTPPLQEAGRTAHHTSFPTWAADTISGRSYTLPACAVLHCKYPTYYSTNPIHTITRINTRTTVAAKCKPLHNLSPAPLTIYLTRLLLT